MPAGPIYSWVDPRTQPESIADIIYTADWKEAPLLNILGFHKNNVDRLIPAAPWPARKPIWFDDTLPPNATALTAGVTNVATSLPVTSGTGLYYRVGDILQIQDTSASDAHLEYVEVTAVAADSLTVARDYPTKSGTGVALGDTDKVVRITRMAQELSSPNPSFVTEVGESYNWVQIIEDTVTVSETSEVAAKIGYTSEMDRRIAKRFVNNGAAGTLTQELENTFFHDLRKARTSTEKGSMGGFDTFVSSNVLNASAAVLTEDHLREMYRTIVQANGVLDFMLMSLRTVDYMDQLYDTRIRSTIDENRGGSSISSVMTSNGECYIIGHRNCPDNTIYFVNRHECGWLPYRPFMVKTPPEDRDGRTKRIIGEYTFALTHEAHFGKIHNFAYA